MDKTELVAVVAGMVAMVAIVAIVFGRRFSLLVKGKRFFEASVSDYQTDDPPISRNRE